ncbi:MAG: DUF4097 domain-containing protein [Ruminococcaceae bacterium]|nr:DUF4097 domain-containing protein [Oscillospiraceae bacterium]
MRKTTKIWLIIAASLIVIGLVMFAAVMTSFDWDFTKLNTYEYETNTHEINEKFNNISINTDTADIIFTVSDDDKCKIICYEQENLKHSVDVQNDTLTIKIDEEVKWYDRIGINFGSPSITIYLPMDEYASLHIKGSTGDIEIPDKFKFENVDISLSTGDVKFLSSASGLLKIKTSTGNIQAKNISVGSLKLSVSTGNVSLSKVNCEGDINIKVSTGRSNITDTRCKNVISNGSTGDITLTNVIATKKFSLKRSTGDIKFDRCDAYELSVKTDTGDVKGSLLTDKIFIPQTDTGKVNVPKSTTGGKCEITTDTGDIIISIND